MSEPAAKKRRAEETRAKFMEVFEELTKEITEELSSKYRMPQHAIDWVDRVIRYNVPGGKLNRGISVYDAILELVPNASEDIKHKSIVAGWCIEWTQAFFLVADDIMDSRTSEEFLTLLSVGEECHVSGGRGCIIHPWISVYVGDKSRVTLQSITRRGQPCWYKREEVGNIALNDYLILEAHVLRILKRHFKSEEYYVPLVELFSEVIYRTELGQLLDTKTAMQGGIDINRFNIDLYYDIVTYKTAFYTFYLSIASAYVDLPAQLSLRIAGESRDEIYQKVEEISITIGRYFQIQDDYLDCFGVDIGKIGTDIQDNKCSWLIVQAKDLASEEQKKVLQENYGRDKEEHIEAVKQVYRDLNLPAVYEKYEQETYEKICGMIQEMDGKINTAAIQQLVDKVYKRSK